MDFKCAEETNLILIHSNKLNYTELDNKMIAKVTTLPEGKELKIKSPWFQIVTQYLVIPLEDKLIKGNSYRLYTKFTGELADDLGGFYRSKYLEDGKEKYVYLE